MKLGLATTLSVAGVLAAGAAALAVNSSVLNGTSDVAVGLPATSNSDAIQPKGDASGATLTNVTGSQSEAQAAAADASVALSNAAVTTYSVGDAGTVVVDTSSGSLVIRDIVPNSGWESALVMPGPNGSWRIHFTKGLLKKEIRLSMQGGRVVAQVVDESGSSTPPAFNPNNPTAPTDSLPSYLSGDDDENDGEHDGDHTEDSEDHENEQEDDD